MKTIANVYALIGTLLLSAHARALVYQWPVATGVDVYISGATSATYTVHMSSITIDDPRINADDTMASLASKGVIGIQGSHYIWGNYHRHRSTTTSGAIARAGTMQDNLSTDLFTTVVERLKQYGTGTIRVTHASGVNGEECVGTTMWNSVPDNIAFDYWLGKTWNGGVGSVGDCLGTPPVHQWCALTTPVISFGYGTMNLTEAKGSVKQATVGVSCTTGMEYTLRLRGETGVPLSNGMRAELTADGKPLNTTIHGAVGEQSISLTSTLQGQPERTGDFRGEGVLFVSYP